MSLAMGARRVEFWDFPPEGRGRSRLPPDDEPIVDLHVRVTRQRARRAAPYRTEPLQRSRYDRFIEGYGRFLWWVLRTLFGAALGVVGAAVVIVTIWLIVIILKS